MMSEQTPPSIRIMVADDHPIVRQGLKVVLEAYPGMSVIAEAVNGEQAVQQALAIHPDVIIMDIQMPVMDGITAIRSINSADPQARILVLTSFLDDEDVFNAIKAGAVGYLLKESTPEQLVESIRLVNQGEVSLHPSIARRLMQEIKQPVMQALAEEPLTPRELEVLQCLARGLSNREIAAELTISVRTVTTHVRNILDKLHLANRTQAALYAVDQKMISR